ncbi:hypothetical protein EIP86_004151 [Pleurotus ostreatoroseus]|nr:hypothetical protein EIP86_004151 [Pleurotus ostreatoroseus]
MWLAAITPLLVFSAFLLLLLVSLSVPVTHTIYVLRLTASVGTSFLAASAGAVAHFGVWGYCISSINVSIAGLSDGTHTQLCSAPRLGYDFDSTVQSALRAQDVDPSALSRELTAVLVLHPIACGFAFLALLASLSIFRWHRLSTRPGPRSRSHGRGRALIWTTLALTLLAALLTTVVFLFDVIFVAVAKHRIADDSGGAVSGTWGNAVWMVLGAAIALWLALTSALIVLIRGRGRSRETRKSASNY